MFARHSRAQKSTSRLDPASNLTPTYVPLSGALIAPLNFTGPLNPDCADGAAQVTDGWLDDVVFTVEEVMELGI